MLPRDSHLCRTRAITLSRALAAIACRALFGQRLEADVRVIMFQDKFASKVRDGSKCQTIRKAARCKAGDTLSLRRWKGEPYRSKQEIIREAACESVEPVLILRPLGEATAAVGFNVIRGAEADAFARADGFADFVEMVRWFEETYGLPFNGWLIKWSNTPITIAKNQGQLPRKGTDE